ncbi:hypothetical protein [Spirillospora sp. CA-294931]|uniref:hypothetical protein n=1 Tax=Spirillospora sp. CA-294931 TaxID=3240042 RepID=UPI003D9480E1
MAAGVVLLVVAAVAYGVMSTGDDPGEKRKGPDAGAVSAWGQQAGKQVTAVPALLYTGTVTASGKPAQLRLSVTRTGSATGTLTVAGQPPVSLVVIDGETYVKGGPAFWAAYGGAGVSPENYAGRWTKAPASMPGLDVREALGSDSIARALARAPAKAPAENVDGTPAYKVKTARADYFVTTAAPHRLLRVQVAGQGDPRFAVTEVADAAPMFKELRPRVAALGGALDPALRFRPGRLTFVNCDNNTSGCTVSVPVEMTDPSGAVPDGARASLRATITSKKRSLGTCVGAGPVPANRSLVLRCTVTGRGWRVWMKKALDSPGAHPYEAQARVLGEAVAAADVAKLLAIVDREGGTPPPGPPVSVKPSPKTRK